VPVAGPGGQLAPVQTTSVSETRPTPLGRAGQALRRLVFGPPLDASAIAVERVRKLVALPVLSADALSSVAYGPQAMLAVLVLAELPGLSYSLPVGAAMVVLMLAVGVSYRQTIRAYPQGGGSYIVASEELGRVPELMAAAGLLIDYVMTVAVSIASGVAAITSAYPSMQPATVWIDVPGQVRVGHRGTGRQVGPDDQAEFDLVVQEPDPVGADDVPGRAGDGVRGLTEERRRNRVRVEPGVGGASAACHHRPRRRRGRHRAFGASYTTARSE
jgi:hypothetical protein